MVRVHLRLFASLREATGHDHFDLELAPGASAEDAWRRLVSDHPGLAPKRQSLAVSVNRRYARFDTELADGDELVFIPPICGG